MSDSSNFNLESPKNISSGERRPSAISSWGGSNIQDKEEVPVHLFLSPTDTASTRSSSSHSSRTRKKRIKKATIKETSFSNGVEKPTKGSSLSDKENIDAILFSPIHSKNYNSSDSESYSPFHKKTLHFPKRINKVHDFNISEEGNLPKSNGSESESSSKLSRMRKNKKDIASSAESSADTEIKRSAEMSYRERIRDRFNTMKEKAVESLSRPQSRPQSRLKLLTLKLTGNRAEDLLRQEENEVSAAMERHEKMKLRWREVSRASLEYEQRKSQEECDLFFMDSQELTPSHKSSEEVKSTSGPESSAEGHEASKVLTSELLGIREDWDLIEFKKPVIENSNNEKLWKEKIFYPSTAPVPLENTVEPGLAPRCLEDEGIYVGTKVKIPNKIRNKIKQRVLMTPEGKKWFGKDGELITSPCPLKPISMRPYFDDDSTIQTSEQIIFQPPTLVSMNNCYIDISGSSNYVLDIDLNSIEFSHHPLFSREHVLAERLKELYQKYKKRKETDTLNRLIGKLNALRRTRDNLKNVISEGGDNANLREKLQKYENDIKEVRQMRFMEGQVDKRLAEKILMTWKDLTKVREDQDFQNTDLKLDVRKKEVEDTKAEKSKWEADIKQETKEIVEELKKSYEKELEEYKKSYENWSRRKKKFEEDEKPENEDSIERLSDTESANESGSEKEDFFGKEPVEPKSVDLAEVKAQVIENYKESFRRPGEPEIEFSMSKAAETDVTSYNNKEELRRAAVKRCMIFIKLFYNGKEVCRSKSQPLTSNFSVTVSQRFAIRILEWPESLMIEIHEETGTLNKNLLVPGIYLPFPDCFTTIKNSDFVRNEFSSKISITYHHTGVGAGQKFIPCPGGSEFNNQPVYLYTSGTVICRIGWMDDGGKILAPPEKYCKTTRDEENINLSEILRSGGTFDVSKIKEWARHSKLDPNDPYNSVFFYFLENIGDSEKSPSYFRLNPLMDEFNFCEESHIENNIRFKLLKLRDSGESEFRDLRMIPLNEKQIHKEIFKDYEKRLSTPYPLADIIPSEPLDGHRAWGKKYLEQVQQKLLKQCRMSKQNRRFQDIITEETVPDIGTLGLTFMKWLQPKRPLRPVRKERKKIPPQNLSGQEVNIVVNVVRAFEVPVRKDVDSLSTGESIEGFSLVNVRPFVEISFRGMTARTTAAEGANPTWNQDLQIPLAGKHTGNLQTVKDTLYLHLFDEMVIDLIEDESARETNIHQRLERHWLASMKIPFSTLFFNSRIEGTFKLYSPPVLLGYEREAHRRHFSGATGADPLLPQRDATYITLFVTVQPALNPPKLIKEKMESSETITLEKHLEGWQEEIRNMFPHRKIKTLVLDITGKSVCVTRFVKSLPLPPIIEEEENITAEMVARFVAMIPSIADSSTFPEFFDIWLTDDQILRLLCGDSEDHAILLCSYFLQLGYKAYILLGYGIPHGLTAYVLVRQQVEKIVEYFVWDPTNGQKYNVDDSFCPLQKVYCLINNQNIWANIQAEEMLRRTRFDLSKRADWFPAFGKNISAPIDSVQPDTLHYKKTSRQAVDFLQDKIEKKLRDNIMKWRRKSRTQWNRYCAATLRRLLPKLEESTWNIEDHSPDHILELQHILASHKMCGFPINMAYTNIEALTEAVKATGVHLNETEGVEFALAVYIHPYPNDILSVWIYVASLIRRR